MSRCSCWRRPTATYLFLRRVKVLLREQPLPSDCCRERAMNDPATRKMAEHDLMAAVRRAARQEQFLEVVSADEARARWARHLALSPLAAESVPLADALARVLAADVIAPIDVPPFDRSAVDGFALRAADTVGAGDVAPRRLALNAEVIACGHQPALEVTPNTASIIATGGALPPGAPAPVLTEHTR